MKTRITIMAAVLSIAASAASFGQLSMAKADWARGPVQFLMTPQEQTQWNAVKNDAEADKFVALFWARRDPTPGTPRNEFREEFEIRVQYADKNFASGRQRGSLTDRGKILILFGAPAHAVRSGGGNPLATPAAPGANTDVAAEDANAERQTWIYEGPKAEKMFGAARVELRFIDRLNNHDLRLEAARVDLTAAQQRIAAAAITQPQLTEPPAIPQQAAQQPAAPVPVVPMTTLKTAALETAVADAKAGKVPAKGAVISYAEFVSPGGDYYVPAGLYVPRSAGVTADSVDTFFGVVEDAAGKRVLAFEEAANLAASRETPPVVETTTTAASPATAASASRVAAPALGDLFIDKTLDLPSGDYTAIFGLAKAGVPVLEATAQLKLSAVTKDSTGTSRLILSNRIQEMTSAAPMKSPFAFGKLKIVPKADLEFTNKDDLNYFVEVHNPGIDATTSLPKLQLKLELLDGKGKIVAGAPLSDAQALPLSGRVGPGQYAIISGIPLSQMSKPLAPGDYTLKMKILDTVSKQSYNLEQKFKITA